MYADGPTREESWLCYRCARDAPGGHRKNWAFTRGKARVTANDPVYLAADDNDDEPPLVFYRGTVAEVHPTFFMIRWDGFALDATNPEAVPKDSYRLWHGTMADNVWKPVEGGGFVPESRSAFPQTFAEIAEEHGVPDSTACASSQPANGATKRGRPRRPTASPSPSSSDGEDVDAAEADEAGPSRQPTGGLSAAEMQEAADLWLVAAREYGEQIGDAALADMPETLSMRRDMLIHPYALFLVVQVRSSLVTTQQPACPASCKLQRLLGADT